MSEDFASLSSPSLNLSGLTGQAAACLPMAGKKVFGSRVVPSSAPGSMRDSVSTRPSTSPPPARAFRRDLRASTVTNSNALKYDSKYHPLDDFTKPFAASKRRKLHGVECDSDPDGVASSVFDSDEEDKDSVTMADDYTIAASVCLSDDEDELKSEHTGAGLDCTGNHNHSDEDQSAAHSKPGRLTAAGTLPQLTCGTNTLLTKRAATNTRTLKKSRAKKHSSSSKPCSNDSISKTRLKQNTRLAEVPKLVHYKSFDELRKKYEKAWQKLANDEDIQSKLERKSTSYISAWEAFAADRSDCTTHKQDAGPFPFPDDKDDHIHGASETNQYVYIHQDLESEIDGRDEMATVATLLPEDTSRGILGESSSNVTRLVTSTPVSSDSNIQVSSPPAPVITYYTPLHSHVDPQELFRHASIRSLHEIAQYGPWIPPASSPIVMPRSLYRAKQNCADTEEDLLASESHPSLNVDRSVLSFEHAYSSSDAEAEDRLARFGVVRARPSSSGRPWDPAA